MVDAQLVEMPPQGFEGPLVALGRAAVLVVSVRPGILHHKNRCRFVQSRYVGCKVQQALSIVSDPNVFGPPVSGSISTAPDPSTSSKNKKKNHDFYYFVTPLCLFIFGK